MDKALRNTIIAGIIIIALSVAYYLVIFLPHSANNKTNASKEATSEIIKSDSSQQQPSERAFSAAAKIYAKFISKTDEGKGTFFEKYSSGQENIQLAIHNYALFLDSDNEKLNLAEKVASDNNSSNPPIFTPIAPVSPAQVPQTFQANDGESPMEKYERESAQQCQKDLAKYNACLSEYNAKMTEYSTCISQSTNPSSSYCFKPSNYCFKPLCAY